MEIALIACCKTKITGGDGCFEPSTSLSSILIEPTYARLLNLRRTMAKMWEYPPGHDLGFEDQDPNIKYIQAYRRYAGIVYKDSEFANLYPKVRSLRVIIISALYGILDADDLIRNYELNMNCKLPTRNLIKTWWKHNGLGDIVAEYIQGINHDLVHDLLPIGYRDALKPWPPDSFEGQVKIYKYPGQGIGSNWNRGSDLRHILNSHM